MRSSSTFEGHFWATSRQHTTLILNLQPCNNEEVVILFDHFVKFMRIDIYTITTLDNNEFWKYNASICCPELNFRSCKHFGFSTGNISSQNRNKSVIFNSLYSHHFSVFLQFFHSVLWTIHKLKFLVILFFFDWNSLSIGPVSDTYPVRLIHITSL